MSLGRSDKNLQGYSTEKKRHKLAHQRHILIQTLKPPQEVCLFSIWSHTNCQCSTKTGNMLSETLISFSRLVIWCSSFFFFYFTQFWIYFQGWRKKWVPSFHKVVSKCDLSIEILKKLYKRPVWLVIPQLQLKLYLANEFLLNKKKHTKIRSKFSQKDMEFHFIKSYKAIPLVFWACFKIYPSAFILHLWNIYHSSQLTLLSGVKPPQERQRLFLFSFFLPVFRDNEFMCFLFPV